MTVDITILRSRVMATIDGILSAIITVAQSIAVGWIARTLKGWCTGRLRGI
jgi:hypothetical protein